MVVCYGPANVRVVVPLTYGGIRWGNRNDVYGEVESAEASSRIVS